jgi:hypothetical protein
MTTAELASWFRDTVGAEWPLPPALSPGVAAGETVWVSGSLAGGMPELPMIPGFRDQPGDYLMAGHWGHGATSWAIYYIGRWGQHRVFFRLDFGGVYGDRALDGAFAARYLAGYAGWRERWLARTGSSTLIHNMGDSSARIELGGRVLEVRDEDPTEPDTGASFWHHLDRRLARSL